MAGDLPSGRDGRFRPIGVDVHTGRPLEVALLPGGEHASRRTIPEALMQQHLRECAALRERHPKGSLLGNTQRHRVPTFSLPRPIAQQWERELGPYHENRKAWHDRLRRDFSAFLTSGYRP